MIVFAVMALSDNPGLGAAVRARFPNDYIVVTENRFWLVAANSTSLDISNALGVTPGNIGSAIVFATAGYFGRAPGNIWEWIKAKLEAPAPAQVTPPPKPGTSAVG